MTMVVRDEEEMLATNLDYHFAQGVELILVTDHGSTDGTPAILAEYARDGRVRCWREEGDELRQAFWVARMLRAAREEHGADWVLHGDADEFWVPLAGNLQDVFAAVPERYGHILSPRTGMPVRSLHNFLPPLLGSEPFPDHMTIRRRVSSYLDDGPIHPKVAQRPSAGTMPFRGNHYILDPVMPLAPDTGTVEIHHFQVRGYEGLLRRMRRAQQTGDAGEGLSPETKAILESYREGELPAVYERIALGVEEAAAGLESGDLVYDDRVRRYLNGQGRVRPASAQTQRLLAAIWAHAEEPEHQRKRTTRRRRPIRRTPWRELRRRAR